MVDENTYLGLFNIYQGNQMGKDPLEKLADFSAYRENRSKLEVSCQENPSEGKKKYLKGFTILIYRDLI